MASKIHFDKTKSCLKLVMYAGSQRLPIIRSVDAKNPHWKQHRWRVNLGLDYLKWIFETHWANRTDLTSVRILATENHPFLKEDDIVEVYAINEMRWASPALYQHIQQIKSKSEPCKESVTNRQESKNFRLYIPLKQEYYYRKDNKIFRSFTIYKPDLIALKDAFFNSDLPSKMAENTQPQLYNFKGEKIGWLDMNQKQFVTQKSAIAS